MRALIPFLKSLTLALAAGTLPAHPGHWQVEAQPAWPPPATKPRHEALFNALAEAASENEARVIEQALWEFWFTAPDAPAQKMLDTARERRRYGDYTVALETLDQLVTAYPDYPEGWNQRATIYFLQGRYDESLADVARVLALEPRHFGALSGKFLILSRLGRTHEAQITLRDALRVDPWLRERGLLLPEYREEKL